MIDVKVGNNKTFWVDEKGKGHPLTPAPGGCTDFLNDWSHTDVWLSGGNGSSKTLTACWKLLLGTIYNSADNDGNWQDCPSLAVMSLWSEVENSLVPTLAQLAEHFGMKWSFLEKKRLFILTDINAKIMLRTATNPLSLRSISAGYGFFDECAAWSINRNPKLDPFEQAPQRIRLTNARVRQKLYVSTPETSQTPFSAMFEEGSRDGKYRASTRDCPWATAYVREQEERIPRHLWSQYIEGLPVDVSAGKVYIAFDEKRNVDEKLKLDHTQPLIVCFDFNPSDIGDHCMIGHYYEKLGLFTTLYEINEPHLNTRRACELLKRLIDKHGGFKSFPLEVVVGGDPAGKAKDSSAASDSCYTIIHEMLKSYQAPVWQRLSKKKVFIKDRVDAANLALCNFDNKVKWRIHPRCKHLIRDLKECIFTDQHKIKKDRAYRFHSHASDAVSHFIYRVKPAKRKPKSAGNPIFGTVTY